MSQQILDMLLEQDDVTWKSLLYDLVKSEEMDPWAIDISLLTNKYLETVKALKQTDLRLSGKVLLAAAFLLKLKSVHLIDNDISNLDRLLAQTEEALEDEDFLDDFESQPYNHLKDKEFKLIPRQPQPRTRQVSIYDLVDALQKAMETKKRKVAKQRPQKIEFPARTFDIMDVIRDIYARVRVYLQDNKGKQITFSQLLPKHARKMDKVYTFIPVLHLEHQRKIETTQAEPFSEIFINLFKRNKK